MAQACDDAVAFATSVEHLRRGLCAEVAGVIATATDSMVTTHEKITTMSGLCGGANFDTVRYSVPCNGVTAIADSHRDRTPQQRWKLQLEKICRIIADNAEAMSSDELDGIHISAGVNRSDRKNDYCEFILYLICRVRPGSLLVRIPVAFYETAAKTMEEHGGGRRLHSQSIGPASTVTTWCTTITDYKHPAYIVAMLETRTANRMKHLLSTIDDSQSDVHVHITRKIGHKIPPRTFKITISY